MREGGCAWRAFPNLVWLQDGTSAGQWQRIGLLASSASSVSLSEMGDWDEVSTGRVQSVNILTLSSQDDLNLDVTGHVTSGHWLKMHPVTLKHHKYFGCSNDPKGLGYLFWLWVVSYLK